MIEPELTSHSMFRCGIRKVVKQLGQRSERYYFKSLPHGWKVWLGIFTEVFGNKVVMRPAYFLAYDGKIRVVIILISGTIRIHEPERTEFGCKMFDNFGAYRYLYTLYSRK